MVKSIKFAAVTGAFALSLAAVVGCGDDDTGSGGATSSSSSSATSGSGGSGGGGEGGAGGGPATCAINICTKYGAAVPTVAGAITDKAAADPQFSDDFAGLVARGPDAVQGFKDSLAKFIVTAYGCDPNAYTGPTMEDAHQGMNITEAKYTAFIGLIAGVLSDAGVPDSEINDCFAPPLVAPAFANTIIGQ